MSPYIAKKNRQKRFKDWDWKSYKIDNPVPLVHHQVCYCIRLLRQSRQIFNGLEPTWPRSREYTGANIQGAWTFLRKGLNAMRTRNPRGYKKLDFLRLETQTVVVLSRCEARRKCVIFSLLFWFRSNPYLGGYYWIYREMLHLPRLVNSGGALLVQRLHCCNVHPSMRDIMRRDNQQWRVFTNWPEKFMLVITWSMGITSTQVGHFESTPTND